MIASACVTLAFVHCLIWWQLKAHYAHLLFAAFAAAVCVFSLFELSLLRAQTVEEFGALQRWIHVPVFVTLAASIWFLHYFFGSGRVWLAVLTTGMYALLLASNFAAPVSMNYLAIVALQPVELWGGVSAPVAVGIVNPWSRIEGLTLLLWAAYVSNASIGLWRRGEPVLRRRAVRVGGSLFLLVLIAAPMSQLIHEGILRLPYLMAWLILGPLLAMAYELGREVVRAVQLGQEVQRGQRQLLESEERLRLATEAANVGMWIWDIGEDDVWASSQCRALLGWATSEKVTFEGFIATLHAEDRETTRRAVEEAVAGKGTYETEFRTVVGEAGIRWFSARGQTEFAAAGGPLRMRGVVLDVTERKRAEKEAAERRNELAHLSRVAMLGELSGALAHELNQPLTAILSNAQAARRFLAQGPSAIEEVVEILGDIVEDDKRAGEVIRRLRALLRKEDPQFQLLDVNEVVLDVLRLMRSDLLNRSVRVRTDLEANLPRVKADVVQLQQVLLNLILNACDAMSGLQPGQRELTIRTESGQEDDVRVHVVDKGTGIPHSDLDAIFEPFVTTKASGMGLGLAVCRTLIKAHGGAITAANNDGRGASLCFTLPAKLDQSLIQRLPRTC